MQTTICLVRHGVTPWNYEGRAQGRTDIPLSAEGKQQAEAAARRLATASWDAVYSSSLSRAFQTAEAIAALTGHTVQPDSRLVERNMGIAEGSTHSERLMRWPGKHFMELPGVETNAEMVARATAALREIALRHPGQRVICVSHGGLMKAFWESLERLDETLPAKVFPGNTSIAHIAFDGERFVPLSPPDNSHVEVDGVEFSGERGRVHFGGVHALAALTGLPLPVLDGAVSQATAVESAWAGGELVAFTRLFTDGVLAGFVDLSVAAPSFQHLIPVLMDRLSARYPNVPLTVIPPAEQQQAGD